MAMVMDDIPFKVTWKHVDIKPAEDYKGEKEAPHPATTLTLPHRNPTESTNPAGFTPLYRIFRPSLSVVPQMTVDFMDRTCGPSH